MRTSIAGTRGIRVDTGQGLAPEPLLDSQRQHFIEDEGAHRRQVDALLLRVAHADLARQHGPALLDVAAAVAETLSAEVVGHAL
jgi:hypothetical protein